ncbi:hypothetical protein TNIN_399111 [Trichonephila inaurata madagascariensis]|uniref:Uncharacterized protein n=1 Tax=Trichonephila inaurata madagascariensis TaxID=2747483 RepID=A0A8X7CR80_9ARAC|nr:hypothetical protein TNIN_399111 [Trichonephila inaurata madagascariensis]
MTPILVLTSGRRSSRGKVTNIPGSDAAKHIKRDSLTHSMNDVVSARCSISPLCTRCTKLSEYIISEPIDWIYSPVFVGTTPNRSSLPRFLFGDSQNLLFFY